MRYRLTIISGKSAGKIIEPGEERVSLGRGPDNAVVLPDAGASARHCEIYGEGGKLILKDLRSSNGTLLNGRTIDTAELRSGDAFVIGETRIEVQIIPAAARRETPPAAPAVRTDAPAPSPKLPPKSAAPGPAAGGPPLKPPQAGRSAPARSGVQPPAAEASQGNASRPLSAIAGGGIGASLSAVSQDTPVFDKRSVVIGLLIFALLVMGGFTWTLKTTMTPPKPVEKDFEFSVAEPKVEDLPKLREPIRDVLKEKTWEEQSDQTTDLIEAPNIQVSTAPVEVQDAQMVIRSPNVSIDTPVIDVSGTEMEIQDAPAEISVMGEVTSYALDVIAETVSGPADFYQHTEPVPPGKMQLYTFSQAPRPGKPLVNMPKAFGDQNAPTGGKLGAMDVNLFGNSDHFFHALQASLPIQSRQSVEAALNWLAIHQDPDGEWKCEIYEGNASANLAVTGMGALALMGGGNTLRKGEYKRHVVKAIEAIMRKQDKKTGAIGAGYTHAICTIALCEAFGRANDERVGRAAQQAVRFCETHVNKDSGWRYAPNSPDSDMSVSSWFIQALKTAKLAQVKFDHSIFSQALLFVDSATDQGASQDSSGMVLYTVPATGSLMPANAHPALTCAAMLIRQFNGMGVKNHILVKGAEATKASPPNWKNKNFYLWYYATYAMHNMGGEYRIWWSQRIMNMLRDNQVRQGEHTGSWDPKGDAWAGTGGGRVYTTALGALCMEVGYRYSEALNSFGTAPDIEEMFMQ